MAKYNFDMSELTDDSMSSIHRYIEEIYTRLKAEKDNPILDTEHKEVLSYFTMSLIKIEDVLDTLIAEMDYIKTPWYKKLFRK